MDGLLRALIKTVRRRLRADEEVTVEAVTKELGYTRQYISGRFHRITGRLLSHFLKEKRLEKAARLLKTRRRLIVMARFISARALRKKVLGRKHVSTGEKNNAEQEDEKMEVGPSRVAYCVNEIGGARNKERNTQYATRNTEN